MTIRIDQIGQAILNAPGAAVEILKVVPPGTQTVTSATFVDLTGISGSFNAPVAGTYSIDLQIMGVYGGGSANQGAFRLVFDVGTGAEQYLGDNTIFGSLAFSNSIREWRSITGFVTLTAGTHTIKVQGLKNFGTSLILDTSSGFRAEAKLVNGSGAGGILVSSKIKTADQSVPRNTVTLVTELSHTVTVTNESVDLEYMVICANTSSAGTPVLAYRIDGGSWLPIEGTTAQTTYWAALSGTKTVSLSTGSHVIDFGLTGDGGAGTWTVFGAQTYQGMTWQSRTAVRQHRGGLVPIQKDGVDINAAPRALNFTGSGVSVSTDTGVATIQLNNALTVPGTVVPILQASPSTTRTTTSGSYADIDANFSVSSIVVPTTGTYMLIMKAGGFYDPGSGSEVRFRVLLDDVTVLTTDDKRWEASLAPSRENWMCEEAVSLTAGTHSFKVQWKRASGAGTTTADTVSHLNLQAVAVTGSGAGGVIKTEATDSADRTGTGSSVTEITQLALSVTASPNEVVLLTFTGSLTSAGENPQVYYQVDSGGWVMMVLGTYATFSSGSWSAAPTLTAGAHTIKIGLKGYGSGSWTLKGTYLTSRHTCLQFRGGLVPVRKDGASVIDTPAAFDFVGSNFQVTNVGGTAKIQSLPQAQGAQLTSATATSNPTTISSATYADVPGLSTSITVFAGETVLFSLVGAAYASGGNTAFTAFTQWVDGSGTVLVARANSRAGSQANTTYPVLPLEWAVPYTFAVAGTYTVKIQAKQSGGNWSLYDGAIQVTQFRGGYVQPENIPILEYLNTGSVYVKAAPGASSNLRLLMNDGARYQATSPLALSLGSSGLGGLDTGTKTVSTWYYIYAVPSTVSGYFSVVASITPPTGGPTGYPVWRYLGAIYNNSSNNIRVFTQQGSWFFSRDASDTAITLYASDAQPTQNTWVSCTASLANAVPISVTGQVNVIGFLDSDGSQIPRFWLEPGNPPTFTPTSSTENSSAAFLSAQFDCQTVNTVIRPLFDGTMSWYYIESGTTANINVAFKAIAWQDKYLTGQTTQLQATYQPDTALPQLTWVGNSQVTIAAAPGQGSAVKLTLQDGTQRSFAGTLTWDPSTGVLDGGLDAGTETVSTWYYLYLVPRYGTDAMLHVRGSVNAPSTGPSGYSNYRYIGAVRNNASGNIIQFYQTGNYFKYASKIGLVIGAGVDASPVQLSLSTYVPASASLVDLDSYIQANSVAASYAQLWIWVSGLQGGGISAAHAWSWGANASGGCVNQAMVPTPTTAKELYYQRLAGANPPIDAQIEFIGWIDAWIGGASTGTTISGANGTLTTQYTLPASTNYLDISGSAQTWYDLGSFSVTFTAAQGEDVLLCASLCTNNSTTTLDWGDYRIIVDGDESKSATARVRYNVQWGNTPVNISYMCKGLSAGSHTAKVQWLRNVVGLGMRIENWTSPGYEKNWLSATQFRGGLVPVQKDGIEIINTPAAYNFIGPNVQVTGAGNKANITYNGVAEGTIKTEATDAADRTGTGSSVTEITQLALSVTTVANEIITLSFAGSVKDTTAAGSPVVYYQIDSGGWVSIDAGSNALNYGSYNNWSFPVLVSSAGAHTIRLGIKTLEGHNWTLQGTILTSRFACLQYRGGYIQPENIPILAYYSVSQVRIQAALGASSTLWLQLNDGVRYQATSPLTVDLTVSGRGGIDTGSEAANTWYYVYAVPSLTSGQFSVLCSVTPPPIGPTGYPIWRYLGAIRNNASSNITNFQQVGADFHLWSFGVIQEATGTQGVDASPVELSLAALIPATSSRCFVRIHSTNQDAAANQWIISLKNVIGGTFFFDNVEQAAGGLASNSEGGWVSFFSSAKSVWRHVQRPYGTDTTIGYMIIGLETWTDGYLSALPSQLQAKYTPDTAAPQMLWRGNSRVDVQAQPGQPSTILLTLQDGKQRSMSGYLTWDPSTGVVDGGLDTGTEAISTWYYLYMVPNSGADDFLHVRGSVNPPPTGPTGYTNWRYIGAVRNDGSGNLMKFYQDGNLFAYATNAVPMDFTGSGGADGALQTCVLTNYVPATTLEADVLAYFQCNGTGTMFLFAYGQEDISSATTRWNTSKLKVSAPSTNGGHSHRGRIPTPGATKQFTYIRDAFLNSRLECQGWFDGYLGAAAGFGSGGPIGNTLNGAYNQGGSGAGRVITANAGAVEINASGGRALKLDGYLDLTEISTPTSVANRGFVYAKDDSGDTELCYRDDKSRTVQITKDGLINASFISADSYQAKVSSADTTPGYLQGKVSAGSHLVASKLNAGANEQLRLDVNIAGLDGYNVKVSSGDTAPGFLEPKLVAGNNIILTKNNPGGSETLTLATPQVLKLDEQVSDPVQFANDGYLYSKDALGLTELFYRDSDGNILQISKAGRLNLADGYISFRYDELAPGGTTGAEASLTLAAVPVEAQALHVFRNGMLMRPVDTLGPSRQEYTLSGVTVGFQPSGSAGDWYSALYIDGYMMRGAGGTVKQHVALTNNQGTDSAVDTVVGSFPIAAGDYSSQTIKFLATAFVTSGSLTGHVKLYNVTDSALVSDLVFSSVTTAKQISSALTLPSAEKMYEVRITVTGGSGPTDRIVCMWAGLQIG